MGRNLCFGLAHVVRGKRRIGVGSFRYNVAASCQLIVLYILAPLPQTFRGNKYILVIIDYFNSTITEVLVQQ